MFAREMTLAKKKTRERERKKKKQHTSMHTYSEKLYRSIHTVEENKGKRNENNKQSFLMRKRKTNVRIMRVNKSVARG